jgi:amino acid transporter
MGDARTTPVVQGPGHVVGARAPSVLAKKITLLPLVAATYFMVAGGPYGLEDMIKDAGYLIAVLALIITPLIWSLPTALMVSELASAIPEEGGYYAWVRRAMGPFWGFQEAWLSLAASIFDMALYPTIFVTYLNYLTQGAKDGYVGWAIGSAVIAVCAGANILGARSVGFSSVLMSVALLGPFVVMTIMLFARDAVPPADVGSVGTNNLMGAIIVAMWNCMGWDNASTIAGEVERPQRTYPLAMILTVLLLSLTYVLPVWAVARTGIDPASWKTGAWVDAAREVGGSSLKYAVIIGGMVCGLGMCNSLVLSYSRVPVVLAESGYLPPAFCWRHPKTRAPWMSILACSVAWALALKLSFEDLVILDVILYGLSLVLEFVALFILRLREPSLARPFRVPGGNVGALLLGLMPTILLGLALYDAVFHPKPDSDLDPITGVCLGGSLVVLGPVVYFVGRWLAWGTPVVDQQVISN